MESGVPVGPSGGSIQADCIILFVETLEQDDWLDPVLVSPLSDKDKGLVRNVRVQGLCRLCVDGHIGGNEVGG